MRLTLTMVLLFSGCMSAGTLRGGTAVGNPPDAKIRTEVGESVTLSAAELRDAQLVLAPCDLAQPVTDDALGVVSLLDGPAVALTGQAPCGVALKAEGLILDGVTDDGSVVAIALEDFDVELGRDSGWTQASFEREGHFVLELGEPGWLHDMRLELADDDLVIDAEDPRAEQILDRLAEATGLYADPDGDGVVADADRADAAMGSWIEPEREPEDED